MKGYVFPLLDVLICRKNSKKEKKEKMKKKKRRIMLSISIFKFTVE